MELWKIFYENEYDIAFKFISENNLTINEIEPDENGRRFQIAGISSPTECDNLISEMIDIKEWFETEYSKQEQKFRRLRTLNILCDDGVEPYDALIKLYNDAEVKRKRIQELELLIAKEKELEKQNQTKGEIIDA